jgi:hypothetical protein
LKGSTFFYCKMRKIEAPATIAAGFFLAALDERP